MSASKDWWNKSCLLKIEPMSFRNTKTPSRAEITKAAKWQLPTRKVPKSGATEYVLEGENRERFIKLFPVHSNRRLMQWFGISFSTCQRFKRELGLKKNMTAIRKELARDVKKICEKNGYYDSLRGKAPSEAAIEAMRKMRAEGFHPMKRLKEKNPAKYRKVVKRMSADRKELIRKERFRESYGLERETKLKVVVLPMGHRASSQKHSMIKRFNYYADPDHPTWVYYDSETRRSPRSEATAERHGLRVLQGAE